MFSDFDSALLKALVIGKATDTTLCATRNRMRTVLGNEVEREDVILVQELLPKRSRKEQILVPRVTATKTKTLRSLESKSKIKIKIAQKVKDILTINKPPYCLAGSRSKRPLRRKFGLS